MCPLLTSQSLAKVFVAPFSPVLDVEASFCLYLLAQHDTLAGALLLLAQCRHQLVTLHRSNCGGERACLGTRKGFCWAVAVGFCVCHKFGVCEPPDVCAGARTALDGDMLSQFLQLPVIEQRRMVAAVRIAVLVANSCLDISLHSVISILETALSRC